MNVSFLFRVCQYSLALFCILLPLSAFAESAGELGSARVDTLALVIIGSIALISLLALVRFFQMQRQMRRIKQSSSNHRRLEGRQQAASVQAQAAAPAESKGANEASLYDSSETMLSLSQALRRDRNFSRRLDMAFEKLPSDVMLQAVFRGENSDLCKLHDECQRLRDVDLDQLQQDEISDGLEESLCDMHGLIYNITVAIEKLRSAPHSTARAEAILAQAQLQGQAIQRKLRALQRECLERQKQEQRLEA